MLLRWFFQMYPNVFVPACWQTGMIALRLATKITEGDESEGNSARKPKLE